MRLFFFFSSRRRHTRWTGDWSSDVCSSDLIERLSAFWKRSKAQSRSIALTLPRPMAQQKLMVSSARGWSTCRVTAWERSEERRVGKEWRARWEAYHQKKKMEEIGAERESSD